MTTGHPTPRPTSRPTPDAAPRPTPDADRRTEGRGRRPRWLVAVTEYAGLTPYTGGIGRHYASLLPAVVRQGVDVDLAVYAPGGLLRPDLGGVRLAAHARHPKVPRALLPLARSIHLRTVLGLRDYDAVFLPEWAALGSLLPRSTPLVTNLATSLRLSNEISGHRLRDFGFAGGIAVGTQMLLEDHQIRHSSGLVPISHAMLRRTEELLGAVPPSVVVRNCIDVTEVREASLHAGLPDAWPADAAPTILFLGRLERRKGILPAVAAFAALVATRPDARLILAGSSGDSRFEPDRATLLGAIPPDHRDRVVFLGHVGGEELYRAVREADVVICPSLWEGFGNVALEAKAIGTALVVTTGSGFDDFCTDGVDCLAVPPGDAPALARAMERLLGDPALAASLASEASRRVDGFTADAVAPDLVRAVSSLVGGERGGSAPTLSGPEHEVKG